MDPISLPEGHTLLESIERCLLAAEGYRELGLLDEARRELDEHGAGTRAQWEAMSAAERELRTRWAAEQMPSPEKVFGWDHAPTLWTLRHRWSHLLRAGLSSLDRADAVIMACCHVPTVFRVLLIWGVTLTAARHLAKINVFLSLGLILGSVLALAWMAGKAD